LREFSVTLPVTCCGCDRPQAPVALRTASGHDTSAGSVGGGHSRLFVAFEGVAAVGIIITVYQTARRHMPEERNIVHFYWYCVFMYT
jgi:hypothetical protein